MRRPRRSRRWKESSKRRTSSYLNTKKRSIGTILRLRSEFLDHTRFCRRQKEGTPPAPSAQPATPPSPLPLLLQCSCFFFPKITIPAAPTPTQKEKDIFFENLYSRTFKSITPHLLLLIPFLSLLFFFPFSFFQLNRWSSARCARGPLTTHAPSPASTPSALGALITRRPPLLHHFTAASAMPPSLSPLLVALPPGVQFLH